MTWWRRWLGRTTSPAEAARNSWRTAWAAAVELPERASIDALTSELDALALPEEEIELEREMLEGLHAAYEQRAQLETGALPVLETSHRVIGGEKCHFSAPVFMPDEPLQPAGRLLFTPIRAVFVGGGKPSSIPWHSIGAVQQTGRDLLLVRVDRDHLFRFRTNSYADALCAAQLVRQLMPRRTRTL